MKRIILLVLAFILAIPTLTFSASVRGYWQDRDRDGVPETYVHPHQRTNLNNTIRDNYDYPGNYNPNTGRITPGNPYNSNPYESSHKHKSIWD